jgi:AraC-like DNA-binding protein
MDNPTLVFPRSSVVITQEGEEPLVTDPSVTVMYRGSQEYSRTLVDPVGDRCDWFEVDPQLIRDVAQEIDPAAGSQEESPIKHTHAPASSGTYVLQRMLTRHVASESTPDHFLIQETLARIVEAVIQAAYGRATDEATTIRQSHRQLVEDAKAYVVLHFAERLSLADVGKAVGASSFHLARLFRSHTGRTVHRHLTDIRLRAALDRLENSSSDITEIALGVGFASHSHLTKVFHERFEMTPSDFRAQSSAHLRRIVIA